MVDNNIGRPSTYPYHVNKLKSMIDKDLKLRPLAYQNIDHSNSVCKKLLDVNKSINIELIMLDNKVNKTIQNKIEESLSEIGISLDYIAEIIPDINIFKDQNQTSISEVSGKSKDDSSDFSPPIN